MVRSLPGPAAVTYKSGPTGFGLARDLTAAGLRCDVAAASKLQRPAGDRVKTNARDALHLTRCREDLMRSPHRLSKLPMRHGIVYCKGRRGRKPTTTGC